VKHFTAPSFWKNFDDLPPHLQEAAKKQFKTLKSNSKHPSLNFKKVGKYWSVRVSLETRALSVFSNDEFIWFWIGPHQEYERIISNQKKQ
jgi:hypothetical protein